MQCRRTNAQTELKIQFAYHRNQFCNIKIQNYNIITHGLNSKMNTSEYKIELLILAVITLHTLANLSFLQCEP
jgi:hypothetical protein